MVMVDRGGHKWRAGGHAGAIGDIERVTKVRQGLARDAVGVRIAVTYMLLSVKRSK